MLLTEISTEKSLEKKIYYLIILTLLTIKTQTLGSTHSHNSFESKISPLGRELMVNALSCKSLKHHMFWDWFETNLKFKLLVSSLTPTDYFMRHKLAIGIIWLAFCFLVFFNESFLRSLIRTWSWTKKEQKNNFFFSNLLSCMKLELYEIYVLFHVAHETPSPVVTDLLVNFTSMYWLWICETKETWRKG